MTVDEKGIDNFILSLFPARHAIYIKQKSDAIKEKMGYWLRGQIVLCIVVGLCVYIGFLIIGLFTENVEYAYHNRSRCRFYGTNPVRRTIFSVVYRHADCRESVAYVDSLDDSADVCCADFGK